jgi:nucleotide-binding universal stress UspA family protein
MRVMLATDGSDHATVATEWLKTSPLPDSAEVMVVAAAGLPLLLPEVGAVPAEREAVDRARRAAEDARARLRPRWPRTALRVATGDPREEIPALAAEWGADLVVMGARGLGTVKRLVLGSVSTAVVHELPCAVVVVKGRPAAGADTVVVAVDGSPDSLAAARFAGTLGATASLRLLAVIEPPYLPRSAPDLIAPALRAAASELLAEQRAAQERMLDRVAAGLDRPRGAVATSVVTGRPPEEIVKAANEPGVGLVVVGAHGFGAMKRVLLGSVSERVLHEAECPVLIVKHGG